MALHNSISSQLKESLREYLLVAEYCIKFRKNDGGCLGYPAAILLLNIVDSIGSYIHDGKTRDHFDILNNVNYYNLGLSKDNIRLIYEHHRCLLEHNATTGFKVGLSMGVNEEKILTDRGGLLYLNLEPFLNISKKSC